MISRRVVVHGRVQGVGYRYAMVEVAARCAVAGWVRNRADGTVEAVVQGDVEAVERMLAWCRRGPPQARVSSVEAADEPTAPELSAFALRPTA